MRYPWTQAPWTQLQVRRQQQRLPHALLLTGPKGLGKTGFARDLAQSLLCEQPSSEGLACQQCRACARFAAATHPDFLVVEPEEAGKAIKVDQIRDLIAQFTLATHQGGYRVAIVQPAEQMNLAAANSLLKTLEEPPADSLLVLVSANPSLLPATILSRCQRLDFSPPSHAEALAWLSQEQQIPVDEAEALLSLACDAPLSALALREESVLAQRQALFQSFTAIARGQSALANLDPWLKLALPTPIHWLSSWINDLIRVKSGVPAGLRNRDLREGLQNIAQRVDLQGLFDFLDELHNILRMQRSPLNAQMLMEGVLLRWQSLSTAKADDK
ncbi:MAG: DNA polymerase III subunit delta' [Gammaproteobacteria bacterium]|nr:DNA polymerase III subunit delta' [Gammaproteobacteria bacterium]